MEMENTELNVEEQNFINEILEDLKGQEFATYDVLNQYINDNYGWRWNDSFDELIQDNYEDIEAVVKISSELKQYSISYVSNDRDNNEIDTDYYWQYVEATSLEDAYAKVEARLAEVNPDNVNIHDIYLAD